MNKKTGIAAGLVALLGMAPFAGAALLVTNGDFEDVTDFVGNVIAPETSAKVTGWFSVTTGDFYRNTWQDMRDAEVPTDASSGYTGQGAAAFSGLAGQNQPAGLNGSWLYQSIGFDAAATAFDVTFDWGDFQSIGTNDKRDLGLTVSVYEFNGTGSFVAGNDADVLGADGVTLLDSFSVVMMNGALTTPKLTIGETGTLNLSSQNGGELFLRINNYDAGNGDPWLMLDNVVVSNVIPEPATIGLFGVFGAGIVFARRRRRVM